MNNQTAPLNTDDLQTWLDYWSHVHVTGIDLGLERVIPVAEQLGVINPKAKVITVAGTNGKGSTTTTLAAILNAQGLNVGLYQSPHIYRFNERVKLAGQEVDDQTLIDAFVAVDQARRICDLSLSFFEKIRLPDIPKDIPRHIPIPAMLFNEFMKTTLQSIVAIIPIVTPIIIFLLFISFVL